MPSILAFVPARSGSQRIKGKNVRRLNGHPLMAYAIASARESGIFTRVVVSTDSPEHAAIAKHYGAEVPVLRPAEFATSTSPDIQWIQHMLSEVRPAEDAFAILRPTSPFRTAEMIRRAWQRFQSIAGADSLRAVERVRQHPGKMWIVADDRNSMRPLLDQGHLEVTWHAGQYQALPVVYVQNSALEMAWTKAVRETGTREGRRQAPFFTEGLEGFSLDYEDEWRLAESYASEGLGVLPAIDVAAYPD